MLYGKLIKTCLFCFVSKIDKFFICLKILYGTCYKKKLFNFQGIPENAKKTRTDGNSTIAAAASAEDLLFLADLPSGMPHSPSPSDTSQGSVIAGISKLPDPGDDSSNEALVVDCDSPTGRSNTPGKSF